MKIPIVSAARLGARLRFAMSVLLFLSPHSAYPEDEVGNDPRQTILGQYIVRHAGTGTLGLDEPHVVKDNNDRMIRLLELARLGRRGPANNIVNEAVAQQEGYECPSYDQLPLRMEGFSKAQFPHYQWKSAAEVNQAAEDIGFSCKDALRRVLNAALA